MDRMDAKLFSTTSVLYDSVKDFFNYVFNSMDWKTDDEDVVMDVGCGHGFKTNKLVLPAFPKVGKVIALDLLPDMIQEAKEHNYNPKIEYHVASIEDWSTLQQWEGQVTKLVSIHCFHWLKDQRLAFQYVHRLLKSGGEAAVFFFAQCTFHEAILKVAQDSKWNKYFEGVDLCVPESHFNKYDAMHYKRMLDSIGFTVLFCEKIITKEPYPSDEIYTNLYTSLCILVPHVPPAETEAFKTDFIQCLMKLNVRHKDGRPTHSGHALQLVVRKK